MIQKKMFTLKSYQTLIHQFSHLIQNVVTNMTKFYTGVSFPNVLDLSSLIHSFFLLFLSSFITPLICLSSVLLSFFFPLSFLHTSLPPVIGNRR